MPAQNDIYNSADREPFLPPHGTHQPSGFSAPAQVQSSLSRQQQEQMAQVANDLLRDPMLLTQFCDRIYDLMQTDLQQQQERHRGYGRR